VLFAKITPCMENGKAALASCLAGGRGFGSTEFHVLRAREAVLPEWLYYFVRRESFRRDAKRSFTGTAGQQRVPTSFIQDALIPVPPVDEQRRIVDLLSRAEGIVRLRREAQQKAAELIPAIFIDMFGDPATNPKGWPVVKLGELLSSIDSGHSPKCGDRHRGVDEWGVLRLGAVSRCEYDEYEHKTLPRDIDPDTSIEVKSGDLLLSRKNTAELVGASAYVWATGGRILLPDLIFRLRLAETAQVNAIYLWKLLTTDAKRRALTRLATGSAGSMPNISKERLRTLPVKVPTLGLQMKFADFVKEIRSIRQQQQAAIQKAEEVFASLLAGAFSGI
jgi:type I restriction enzyme, S subunit